VGIHATLVGTQPHGRVAAFERPRFGRRHQSGTDAASPVAARHDQPPDIRLGIDRQHRRHRDVKPSNDLSGTLVDGDNHLRGLCGGRTPDRLESHCHLFGRRGVPEFAAQAGHGLGIACMHRAQLDPIVHAGHHCSL